MHAHRAFGRSTDATELRQIAFRLRHLGIEEPAGHVANELHERVGARLLLGRFRPVRRRRHMRIVTLGEHARLRNTEDNERGDEGITEMT